MKLSYNTEETSLCFDRDDENSVGIDVRADVELLDNATIKVVIRIRAKQPENEIFNDWYEAEAQVLTFEPRLELGLHGSIRSPGVGMK
ncbi:MAG: hypothetical protein WC477_04600 [Patescibacteria group bacterium]